jgi:hypothetical protein
MTPTQVSEALRKIADKIDSSGIPSLAAKEIRKILNDIVRAPAVGPASMSDEDLLESLIQAHEQWHEDVDMMGSGLGGGYDTLPTDDILPLLDECKSRGLAIDPQIARDVETNSVRRR